MEGKAVGMLFAFAVIVLCAGGLTYYLEVESKRQDLAAARKAVETGRATLASRTATRDVAQGKHQAIREQIDGYSSLVEEKQELTQQISALEADAKAIHDRFVEAVHQVRAASVGLAWPDVTLPSGQVLKQVSLQRITDTDVSFSHADGLAKIAASDLPEDIRRRFRYGMPPMVSDSETPAPAPAPASAPTVAATPADPNKAIDAKIATLRDELRNLELTQIQWNKQAEEHRSLAFTAQAKGRPTSTHVANANAAEQQAKLLAAKIGRLHEEIKTAQKSKTF